MKNFKKICAWIIGISSILDIWFVLALILSNGYAGAAFSRGMKIIGLPSFFTDYLWIILPIAIVVWVYIDSNKDKYPKFEKPMQVLITLIFIFPWLFGFIAIKLSDQKFIEDKASFEASGKIVQIEGCQFKIFPDNSYQNLGPVPGKICRDPIGVETRAYERGEFKY